MILPDMAVPTPVFSYEILSGRACASLNGTASHNPPQDMGLKYNPSNGGPADAELTACIEKYANECLKDPSQIKEISLDEARQQGLVRGADVLNPYVTALGKIIDFKAIKKAGLKAAIHPLGGASLKFYEAIKERYGLDNLEIVDKTIDPSFSFIPLDHDGKIRMDPSSAGASDPDADRFGCATKKGGLISPNHALCVMADYLLKNRREGNTIGRTLGTTALLDRIALANQAKLEEVNVGFKYFVRGLVRRKYVLAGEESAGMSLSGWTTEKDGILAVCLLLEIMSKQGDIADQYKELTRLYGTPCYTRIDVPTDDVAKQKIKALKKEDFSNLYTVAGERVTGVRDTDGIKVYLQSSWFLVRPSGTENILKFYAESFLGEKHLARIIEEGQKIINA